MTSEYIKFLRTLQKNGSCLTLVRRRFPNKDLYCEETRSFGFTRKWFYIATDEVAQEVATLLCIPFEHRDI